MNDVRRISYYELVGVFFIIMLGSIFHFAFEWSGGQEIVGFFSAVNESVWEHLKIGYWPAVLFALIEYRYLQRLTDNFLFAKTVGIYLIPIVITVLFYSYTAITGESILAVDILTFILAVIVGQLASYKLMIWKKLPHSFNRASLIALIILGVVFVVFTYYPPRLNIFQDPITGKYGIING